MRNQAPTWMTYPGQLCSTFQVVLPFSPATLKGWDGCLHLRFT